MSRPINPTGKILPRNIGIAYKLFTPSIFGSTGKNISFSSAPPVTIKTKAHIPQKYGIRKRIRNEIEEFCRIGEYEGTPRITLFEIDLSVGEAMSIQVLPGYVTVDLNCDDGYGTGIGNGTSTTYIGGQANCTVTGSTIGHWRLHVTNWLLDENGDNVQFYNNSLYDWYLDYSGIAPANFAVYFTMHYVEVYDLDSE